MSIGGKWKRGKSLAGEKSQTAEQLFDYESERARLRQIKQKNQKRGVALSVLLLIFAVLILLAAWQIDQALKPEQSKDTNTAINEVKCDFYDVKAENYATLSNRTKSFVCQIISNRDLFGSAGLKLSSISQPTGFAHAVDLTFIGSKGQTYRLSIDENPILQIGAIIDTEKVLLEKFLTPAIVDLRVQGRAVIKD
jgi:hypothetical protein